MKTIIVTGGANGIGRAIALYFLARDWKVAVWDVDKAAGQALVSEYSVDNLRFIEVDLTREELIVAAVERTESLFGSIDLLVNNAAIAVNKPVELLTTEEWNRVLSINLTAPFIASRTCVPYLRESRGSIINISSTRALQSEANTEAYSASKGGIVALTHALAISLGPEIRVNAVSPGWITVPSQDYPITEADHLQHPAGRIGQPDDIASMVWFLAQPENSFITGQNFIVDGGMTRKMIYV